MELLELLNGFLAIFVCDTHIAIDVMICRLLLLVIFFKTLGIMSVNCSKSVIFEVTLNFIYLYILLYSLNIVWFYLMHSFSYLVAYSVFKLKIIVVIKKKLLNDQDLKGQILMLLWNSPLAIIK